jgi:ADP-heptose:LPS heptosyltransferase
MIDGLPFADLRDQMKSFEDTASIIQGLDLVITSCTSIAHLSAALGKETWVIVPIMPYYAWSAPGDKSVWYDSVRLFRQEKYGEWDAPLKAIRSALEDKLRLKLAA